ncbi:hypothetical protein NW762_004387 [Fusarium torreyae]|uniref:Uncharacterized protein n=1 Tax=Fusarium torreyae TaxID=1237075 RepID=A0A9W8VGU9_9HYPO|nr:hypothetical protein NW762_004387 [Fusarium torreyae]
MATNPQPNGMGPAQSRENYRHSMEEWRQQALAQRNQYQPRVQEQITRSFHEYSPPWYASIIGYRRDWNLLVATSRVSGFASTLGRDLEDEEAKAIAEYTLNNIHTNAALKWFTIGLAGYMTYRGRRTWQFPFYKPKLNGRFNPNEATSLFTQKKIRGPYPRFTWHTLRFTAYAAVTMLMVEPVFRAVNFIRTETAMTNDSRLKQFTKDASKRVEQVMSNPTASRVPFTGRDAKRDDENNPWASNESSETSNNGYENKYQSAPTQYWDKAQSSTATQQSQQHPKDDWSVLDDDDDASPIAASARSQPVYNPSGSAWDRVRQQSQGAPKQQQQSDFQSRGWAARSQSESQPQAQSGWDNKSAGSSSDSFSFSSSDGERFVAKEQAQNEFDRLVERERKGVDQENSWGRR